MRPGRGEREDYGDVALFILYTTESEQTLLITNEDALDVWSCL